MSEDLVVFLVLVGVFAAVSIFAAYFAYRSFRAPSSECGHKYCGNRVDPRCVARNCTQHCASAIGCNERCLDAWVHSEGARDVARRALEKARR